jgi:sarcosine oxidase subunit beta
VPGRAHVASGSSGLSVGIIETQYVDPLDIMLRARSMEVFGALERDHGLAITRNGYLRLAHAADGLTAFRASVETQRAAGIGDARVLDRGEVARLVPDLEVADIAGGLFGPSDGYIDGHLYCGLLAEIARARGVVLLTGSALVGEEPGAARAHRLLTTAESVECDVVVNAASAWAGAVGRFLGAPVTLLPQRHQVAVAHLPAPLPYRMPCVMDDIPRSGNYGFYTRHDGEARLLVGLHTEDALHDPADPERYSRSTDPDFLAAVAEKMAFRLPGLADARLAPGWAGLYPMSPDGMPQVGPHPRRPTVICACGAGGSGIQTSPAIGRLAAEWVIFGGPRSIPGGARLRPGRERAAT